jgi:hypothetical protein
MTRRCIASSQPPLLSHLSVSDIKWTQYLRQLLLLMLLLLLLIIYAGLRLELAERAAAEGPGMSRPMMTAIWRLFKMQTGAAAATINSMIVMPKCASVREASFSRRLQRSRAKFSFITPLLMPVGVFAANATQRPALHVILWFIYQHSMHLQHSWMSPDALQLRLWGGNVNGACSADAALPPLWYDDARCCCVCDRATIRSLSPMPCPTVTQAA